MSPLFPSALSSNGFYSSSLYLLSALGFLSSIYNTAIMVLLDES